MTNPGVPYNRSFILRVRNDEPDAQKQPCWRYTLLDPERESRRGFTSLAQLFIALAVEIGEEPTAKFRQSDIVREVEHILGTASLHLPD